MTSSATLKKADPNRAIQKLVGAHARELSEKLQAHRLKLYPPAAQKTVRRFTSSEVAGLLGVDPGYLRRINLEGKGPQPEVTGGGRRLYTVEDLAALRSFLDEGAKGSRRYLPHRRPGEHLQVICAVNFKGGSG